MSNAESSPRPEEGQDRNPAQAPNPAGPDEAPRAEPTARPDAAQPQPAGTDGPPAAAEQARPEPGPEQAPPAGPTEPQAQQTRAMPSGPPPSAPHMTGPNDAPHSWQPHTAPLGPPPSGYGPHGPVPQRGPKRGRGGLVAGAVALALLAGGAGGAVGWYLGDGKESDTVVESVSMDAGSGMTYTEIVDKVTPSVVTLVTDVSEGSGVVYSEDGYIVTNNHVVEGASAVEVRFPDGSVGEAEVVATDATQDLAVVQVSGVDEIQPIAFGDSDALQVGDATVAIGSPLGLEGTVTTGIVSALNRSMSVGNEQQQSPTTGQTLSGLIQTDAAINMGNSGGALVNGAGELIGINTAILSPESGNVGLGFAIPSNTVKDVVEQLIENGSVEQGYLGVSVTDTQGNGAMVLAVEADSPAAEAGLEEGDVITEIDGEGVTGASEVVSVVQSKASGDTISITFLRDNEEQSTEATLTSK